MIAIKHITNIVLVTNFITDHFHLYFVYKSFLIAWKFDLLILYLIMVKFIIILDLNNIIIVMYTSLNTNFNIKVIDTNCNIILNQVKRIIIEYIIILKRFVDQSFLLLF